MDHREHSVIMYKYANMNEHIFTLEVQIYVHVIHMYSVVRIALA